MSDLEPLIVDRSAPFSDDPSKAQWLGLLRELSAELNDMELEAARMTKRASAMRSRINMIVRRLSD